MDDTRIAVVGIGATGAVLAAALLKQDPDTMLVDPRPGLGRKSVKTGSPSRVKFPTMYRSVIFSNGLKI